MLDKITTALNNRIFSNNMIMENLQATKNEVLRRIGVGVCSTFLDKIYGFLPQSLKLRLFLMSPTGKAISQGANTACIIFALNGYLLVTSQLIILAVAIDDSS